MQVQLYVNRSSVKDLYEFLKNEPAHHCLSIYTSNMGATDLVTVHVSYEEYVKIDDWYDENRTNDVPDL